MKAATLGLTTPSLSTYVIQTDRVLDCVPLVSVINNTTDLVSKIALAALSKFKPSTYSRFANHPLVKHLNQKSYQDCILYSIPIVNILVAILRHPSRTEANELTSLIHRHEELAAQKALEEQRLNQAAIELEELKRLAALEEEKDNAAALWNDKILALEEEMKTCQDEALAASIRGKLHMLFQGVLYITGEIDVGPSLLPQAHQELVASLEDIIENCSNPNEKSEWESLKKTLPSP